MKVLARMALGMLLALGCGPSGAATYRVDDAGTLPLDSTALLRWRPPGRSPQGDATLEGITGVAVRLDVSRWVGQDASLYLVFPERGTAALRASWTTQGRLLSGEISPGNRVLVYRGRITGPFIEETLALNIVADGNRLAGVQRIDFHFEIDTD